MDRNKEGVIGNQVDGQTSREGDKAVKRDTKRDR